MCIPNLNPNPKRRVHGANVTVRMTAKLHQSDAARSKHLTMGTHCTTMDVEALEERYNQNYTAWLEQQRVVRRVRHTLERAQAAEHNAARELERENTAIFLIRRGALHTAEREAPLPHGLFLPDKKLHHRVDLLAWQAALP